MSTLNNETEPKKVLVTGASSGIGKEVAKRLVGLKHSVFVTGRDSERLSQIDGVKGSLSGRSNFAGFCV